MAEYCVPSDPGNRTLDTDPLSTDPSLLRDHSQLRSYKASGFEYTDVRVFFRPHNKAAELPKAPAPLPLLVCVPGLGGSVAQFYPLLNSLVDLAPCLSIDFPGCGRSRYTNTSWDAYTTDALANLFGTIIEEYRDAELNQGIVLIGHSMGTALAAQLARHTEDNETSIAKHIVAIVAICPTAGPPDEQKSVLLRRLLWIPGWIFGLWRAWDGLGGLNSPSVSRFVGKEADRELRTMQYRFNQQSRTAVWRRMAYGALPMYIQGKPKGGLVGLDAWASIKAPILLIAGEDDHLTPATEVQKITDVLEGVKSKAGQQPSSFEEGDDAIALDQIKATDGMTHASIPDATQSSSNIDGSLDARNTEDTFSKAMPDTDGDPSTPLEMPTTLPPQPAHPHQVVQSFIMPSPANHTLLYMPRYARVLAGLISDFLASHVTQRLSLAWQLQYLSREGKWDIKNLNKWKSVQPVSEGIGPGDTPIFRAMKTLREADDTHSPSHFVEKWGSVISHVIDISKDQPVYDPRGLERGGTHYHKFPTVSKIPPEPHEVQSFIRLVDQVRKTQDEQARTEGWTIAEKRVIGVHCHYGFNRTGYFIVCYLIERCDMGVQEAIDCFARARPNGIRHSHFLDRLFVRYNMERCPREPVDLDT
ncbi:hypothetical protein E4U56_008465 [Claviceps arundinis]|uniref:Tyrosine specific protein phosphatases domain-containing protein n=1 Tax=Claviceps arundinis TaxID=1623583 RepID=A0A9P7MSF1_9HYPO|nr:hypothetical protein E4U56_008465 [Claviceps arundinis]